MPTRPALRRTAARVASVAVLAAFAIGAGAGLGACSSSTSGGAATLLDAVSPDAAAVVRVSGDGLASAGALLPAGSGALLALIPRERIVELVTATDNAGAASAVVVRVTGSAADFTGFFGTSTETHRGARLFAVPGGATLAAQRDLLVVDADAGEVRATLDRLAGKAPRLSQDRIAARLYARTVREPVGVLTSGDQIGGLLGGGTAGGGAGGIGDLLTLVPLDRVALGLRLSGAGTAAVADGTLWLAPREGTTAATLASLLGLAVGAFRQQPGLDPATATLLKALRFSADGGDVSTPITVPLSALTGTPGSASATR